MSVAVVEQAPLSGPRVIDLTRILAGPFATMMSADLGADVIEIERPGRGDDTRAWGPPCVGDTATYLLAVNRDKRSVTLEPGDPQGREVLWALLSGADVLASNFRPDVMERLGLGADEIAARFPRLIDARTDGFGLEPGLRERPAFDLLAQAESGRHGTGEGDRCITGVRDGRAAGEHGAKGDIL